MPLREAGTEQVDYRTDSLSGTCYLRGHPDCPEKNATRWVISPKTGLDPQTTRDGTSQERKTGIPWTMDMCCRTGGCGSLTDLIHKDSVQLDRASISQSKERKGPRGTTPNVDQSSVSVSQERLSSVRNGPQVLRSSGMERQQQRKPRYCL